MESIHKKTYTLKEAKSKIAKYCAYQERCHQEVRDKLFSFGLHHEDVESIICELLEQDFLNEERFARAFVRGKFIYKKWGKIKLKMELKRRHISAYCIKKGFEEIQEDAYIQTLTDLLEKKINSLNQIKGYQKNYKAVQHVLTKGFESELAWTIVKEKFTTS